MSIPKPTVPYEKAIAMLDGPPSPLPVRVATTEVLEVSLERCLAAQSATPTYTCRLLLKTAGARQIQVDGAGDSTEAAVVAAIEKLCSGEVRVRYSEIRESNDQQFCCILALEKCSRDSPDKPVSGNAKAGVGRATSARIEVAMTLASLRAANHAGLLSREHRANNQKILREWASQTAAQITQPDFPQTPEEIKHLLAESIILDSFNRVASAAIITATNHPRPETILSLFDTSVWLFDANGQRRDSYTDTNLWLAWYPGVNNDAQRVDDVILSMPAAPETAIPWIVKLFENPSSRFRFRGAVDLEDHDVLHVLLGRGLQDQDEAFVLGFAMGTAKTISAIECAVFRLILTRLYPEPYRIPTFLRPAFDLGVQCGRQTGHKNLYKHSLKDFRSLTVGEARTAAGIDMQIVRQFFQSEQAQIPYTIASLRLP